MFLAHFKIVKTPHRDRAVSDMDRVGEHCRMLLIEQQVLMNHLTLFH